jgi:hypothetical protein
LHLFVADRLNREQSWPMREEVAIRLRRAFDTNRGPLDSVERQRGQSLADWVEQQAAAARSDPDYFEDYDDFDPALLSAVTPGKPFDPLSFPSFCQQEREILALMAALDVH